jgi:hypothetical protein
MAQGNRTTIMGDGQGMRVVEVEWEDPDVNSSYLTMMEWKVYAQDVAYALYLPELAPGANQFANSLVANLYINSCKQAVYNHCFNLSRFYGFIQARDIIHANEQPLAAIDLGADECHVDLVVFDLSSAATAGNYRISKVWNNTGKLNELAGNSYQSRALNIGFPPQSHLQIYAPTGFIPRLARDSGSAITGLAISEFHNELGCLPIKATAYTYAVYDGTAVADFLTLTDNSVTEGIATSSDITLSNFDKLTGISGGFPTATANSSAISGEDYVELFFTYTYRPSAMWFSFTSNGGFSQIQVITKNAGAVVNNIIQDVPDQEDEDPVNLVKFPMAGATVTETIIRFIAPTDTSAITVHDICALPPFFLNRGAYMTIQGGTMYGNLAFNGGGYNTPHIVLGNYHLWVDTTGDLRIKNSAPSSSTDGTVVGTQS